MNRPHVHMNVAATADGKIDTSARRGATISSQRDKERVDRLRAESDAVMIGGRTLRDEDPQLTVKSKELRAKRRVLGLPENPTKVAVARRLMLKPDGDFLKAGPAHILLFTTGGTPEDQLQMLRAAGAEIIVQDGQQVDLVEALSFLHRSGIQRLMVEGGATLNYEMLRLGLVDELTIFVAPVIYGGSKAPTLAAGEGLSAQEAIRLRLLRAEQWEDGGVLLHYSVGGVT